MALRGTPATSIPLWFDDGQGHAEAFAVAVAVAPVAGMARASSPAWDEVAVRAAPPSGSVVLNEGPELRAAALRFGPMS